MFVHHDVPLPAFPLCTAWMDLNLKGGDKGLWLSPDLHARSVELSLEEI
jgi:periodic tryptophan protein 1